jgi:hypothetical protein
MITTNSDDSIGAKRVPLTHAGAMSSPSHRDVRSLATQDFSTRKGLRAAPQRVYSLKIGGISSENS